MESFNDFLSTAKTERLRQLNEYKNKGYLIDDKYRMTEKIDMSYYGEYGYQVSLRDFYFYIIEEKGNAYYSIIELYQILYHIGQREGVKFVVDILEQIEKLGNETVTSDYITYRGIEYEVRPHVELQINGEISIFDGSVPLSYQKLVGLLILIQEKSNYFWNIREDNKEYKEGILRLFKALIILEKDHPILKNKGWSYSYDRDRFEYTGVFSSDEKKERKIYYLTKGELDDIISSES